MEVSELDRKKIKIANLQQNMRVFFGRGIIVKLSFGILVFFLIAAVIAPALTPYTPTQQSLRETMLGPSSKYLLGTDQLGRDFLTRILFGARISLVTSVMSSVISALIGVTMGLIAGYFGGFTSHVIMRITDAQLSLPPLIVSMVLASAFGGGIVGVSIVIGITLTPTYIRIVNGLVLSLKGNDYVVAASLVGQSKFKILFTHLLPNCFPSTIVLFTMNLGSAIMIEASLSFLGIGITAPTPAWGSMVSEGYKYLIRQPSLAILPGLCVLLVVVSFNIVGDGLRDALDPRLRGRL
jgi:ABC-type dipeptide/oligopeptide/nickel transport system permease subunit